MGEPVHIPAEAVQRLREAGSLAVLTGAGVSAESGVPTFRGKEGLWKEYKGTELATPQAFSRDPELVWEWYHWRRGLVQQATPNPAHEAIAKLEEKLDDFTLITQNVDGLHLEAGSKNVYEIHGNLNRARCSTCGHTSYPDGQEGIPVCELCSAGMRPDVVWFGESLDVELLEGSFVASARADMLIVAGTSSVVQPAASLAFAAADRGGYVLEVNLDPTPLTGTANDTVLGKAGEVLPQLLEMAWGD
jgi:NAD-dependent deacetylase